MIASNIKQVYLANQKIEVETRTTIKDPHWRPKLVEDGLYIIATANDMVIYKMGHYIFDVEKERGKEKYNLKFRERIK
jgi:hypothetical protein